MNQCKLVVNIKKWVDINKYKYFYIKLVHACWENWQYAVLTELQGVKIDGFLYPNFMLILRIQAKSSSTFAPQ